MSTLRATIRFVAFSLALVGAWTSFAASARADGCYLCGGGSSEACKNYCRYHGEDTFAARKVCEQRGCKVTGTGACPTAVNYKVCQAKAPPPTHAPADSTTVAAILGAR